MDKGQADQGGVWRRMCVVAALAAGALLAGPVLAAGTPAGTLIGNTATLQYSLPGRPAETVAALAPAIVVAKVISVAVTWQDAAAVTANSPDTARPLAFALTNTGNAPETFRLTRDDALGGDQFDPAPDATGAIWIESGAQPGFQAAGPAADIPYVAGATDVALAADASRIAYLLSAIPTDLATGAQGKSALVAASTTPGAAAAAPGALVGSSGGLQVVAGASTRGTGLGSYLVAGVSMGLAKSIAAVADPLGGSRVMSGSVLTYRLVLTLTGNGLAEGVAVRDPLPAGLAYVPGSLTVGGAPRTDAPDADGAAVVANVLTADFGSVPAPATLVIEFKATVH